MSAPPNHFDLPHCVADEEIDEQGHVHNLHYLRWSLRAAGRHSEALGLAAGELWDRYRAGWVVRSHDATYKAAALAGERLIIRTWISEVGRHFATRRYWICRPFDRKLLARVTTRWALVELEQKRALLLPPAVLQRLPPVTDTVALPWEPAT
jgi:acyl-CoA thioester hydrolase